MEGLTKRNESLEGQAEDSFAEGEEQPGKPISHEQLVRLWKALEGSGSEKYSLEALLRGTKVYTPPCPPKPEPTDEFKALMSRLRREEEERIYESMMRPRLQSETFPQCFPNAQVARAFAEANRPNRAEDLGDGDVTFTDIERQLMLILNVVISVLGVAGALWAVARWWGTPARLLFSMGGGILIGLVEVALYSGYVWHVGEARKKEGKVREVKRLMQSWTVGGGEKSKEEAPFEATVLPYQGSPKDGSLKRRRQKPA